MELGVGRVSRCQMIFLSGVTMEAPRREEKTMLPLASRVQSPSSWKSSGLPLKGMWKGME